MAEAVVSAKLEAAAPRVLVWPSYLLAFLASCATLTLQLVAGRLLAPYIGVSLYTWTAVIGVVLAGISLGNWLGGRLADRHPSTRWLGGLFVAGGVSTLATLGLVALIGDGALFRPLPLLGRIFLLTSLLFLLPSTLLGMLTPLVIRLALPDVRRTGRVVGLVYAAGTAGSLVGNFLTGFALLAYLEVTTIVVGVAALLVLLGLLLWARPGPGPAGRSGGAADGEATSADRPAADRSPGGPLELAGRPALGCAVVVVSSFCTMGVELAASRILAPIVGISLYSWTGIIGAVLAGIAIGNFLGGRIADRWPDQRVLGLCLFLGGLASLAVLLLVAVLDVRDLYQPLGLMGRIAALTATVFLLPVLLLGTISPQVIRLAITDLRHAGRVAGQIYAWSCAGAIVGTFVTGWWLIATIGVFPLVAAMGGLLLLLAVAVGRLWREPVRLGALGAVALVLIGVLGWRQALTSTCVRETGYFCIKVYESTRDGLAVRTLVLDHLVHSYVRLDDPTYLGYEHEYVQAEITRFETARAGAPHVLQIGGGGYTYPRWVEAALPNVSVDVVEIDPGVTEVNYDYLGLSRSTRIVSHNLDGRQFVHELAPKGYYGLVVQDAVNDLSVPYHIMTREYNDQIRAVLAPGGAYLLTVIDLYQDGQLLRSAVRTMMQTFPRVQLLSATRAWDSGGAAVWVIAGTERGIELAELREFLRAQGVAEPRTLILEPERLQAYVDQGPRIVLTDQYAPVDNLIAPLFTRRG